MNERHDSEPVQLFGGSKRGSEAPHFVLATLPPNRREKKVAFAVIIAMLAALIAVAPFSQMELRRVDSFIPTIHAIFFVVDLITAILLFAQYAIVSQVALLSIAGGYLFAALLAVAQALTFPGAFAPGGLFGAGLQTAPWLFYFWRTGFLLAVIVYAALKNTDANVRDYLPRAAFEICVSVIIVLVAAWGATWLVTARKEELAVLFLDGVHLSNAAHVLSGVLTSLSVLAFGLLWVRLRSVLDLWLMLAVFAMIPDIALAVVFPALRYTAGWYAGRIFFLIGSSIVLVALLAETSMLYGRLARAMVRQGRERLERKRAEDRQRALVAELDHRVKNTLATVSAVVSHTLQGSRSVANFAAALDGRIRSMAITHELLSLSRWQGISLTELIRRELAPYAARNNTEISGTHVVLKPEAGQAMAMVLHELTTNAAKYGALSKENGRVSIRWDNRSNGHARSNLVLEWKEMGGPPVVATGKPGYGTSTIRDVIPYEFGGTVDLVLAPDGLSCRLELPSDWLTKDGAPDKGPTMTVDTC